nr:immunoglobulin heavy chain junction region [Mus musculus]
CARTLYDYGDFDYW